MKTCEFRAETDEFTKRLEEGKWRRGCKDQDCRILIRNGVKTPFCFFSDSTTDPERTQCPIKSFSLTQVK